MTLPARSFTAGNRQFIANDGGMVNLFGTDFLLDGVAIAGLEYGVPFKLPSVTSRSAACWPMARRSAST
jgi:hypothetical protein